MKKSLLAVCLILMVAGCGIVDTLSEGLNHSQEVADDLEKSIGTKPQIGFNWENGSLTNVTIGFETIPAGKTNEEIAERSREAISARFKQEPKQIIITYTLPGKSP